MSASNQTTDASTGVLEAASNKYKTLTGQDLRTHPLATELESNNNSPESVLGVFRKQAQALDKFCNGDDDKLMKFLTPVVNILFAISAALGSLVSLHCFKFSIPVSTTSIFQPFSPATALFTGVGVLLGVSLFQDSWVCCAHF